MLTILGSLSWEAPVHKEGVGDDQGKHIAVAAEEGLVEVVGAIHGVHHLQQHPVASKGEDDVGGSREEVVDAAGVLPTPCLRLQPVSDSL